MAKAIVKTVTLKDKKALLLAEACKIDKEKKKIEARLIEIKTELVLEVGTYTNAAKDALTISESTKMAPINPKRVFFYMKKNNLKAEYWKCVKTQLTELKKQVPAKIIKKWERKIEPIKRWTFK